MRRDNKKQLKIEYAKALLKTELSKFIFLAIFFSFAHQGLRFLYALLLFTLVRLDSGGIHFKSNKVCFFFSFLFFSSLLFFLKELPPYHHLFVLGAICIFPIFAPVRNRQRPIQSQMQFIKLKLRVSCYAVLVAAVIFYMAYNGHDQLAIIGFWVLILQALQIVIASAINYTKGRLHHATK